MALFSSKYFKNASSRVACLVCGFSGHINQYEKAITSLIDDGYDVIAYEYDDAVFAAGDADILPQLIKGIAEDFEQRAKPYKERLATGVSLGAYIAFNVQRLLPGLDRGIYGTAGISVSHVIFSARVFRGYRRKFEAAGYDEASLEKRWHDFEILDDLELEANKSIFLVLGGLDRIVNFKKASHMMTTWKKRGIKVSFFRIRGLGHTTTIWWYKNNLGKLLAKDKSL